MLALDFPQFAKSLSTFLLVVVWPTSSCSLCKIPSFANLNVIFNFPSFFQLASLVSWYFHCNENSSFLACFMMYSLFVTLPFPRKVSKVSPVWVSSSLGAIPFQLLRHYFLCAGRLRRLMVGQNCQFLRIIKLKIVPQYNKFWYFHVKVFAGRSRMIRTMDFFSCPCSSIPTLVSEWVTAWVTIHHSERSTNEQPLPDFPHETSQVLKTN